MTLERKLLLITGSALIAVLIAVAAFALGVYVGTKGFTAGPPSVMGPDGAQPGGAQAAPQPELRPQLVGGFRSLSGDALTLDTPDGPRLVTLTAETQVRRAAEKGEEPATLSDLRRGDPVAVFGRLERDGARRLVAERLLLLPVAPIPPDAGGNP